MLIRWLRPEILMLLFVMSVNVCVNATPSETVVVEGETYATVVCEDSVKECVDTIDISGYINRNFKLKSPVLNIYDLPYSRTANFPNYRRLALNTGVLFGAGFVALGVLQTLPEDATAWNKEELMKTPFFERWGNHVKAGPVWDKDNFVFNYIFHPYGGAAYYMSARSQGFNMLYSSLYCFGISTVFWEYGIEAFMEIPSIQDLIITPLFGSMIGEGFYILKRKIVSDEYTLLGSKLLGNIVAFIIDPVNEFVGLFAGNQCRRQGSAPGLQFHCTPIVNNVTLGMTLYYTF